MQVSAARPPVNPSLYPFNSVSLPAPLGPQTGDTFQLGALRVPRPFMPYRDLHLKYPPYQQLTPDDSAWTESGTPGPDGSVHLSNGGLRYGGPHQGQITGLKVDGLPVTYSWEDKNYWWTIDDDATRKTLDAAAERALTPGPAGQTVSINGSKVSYSSLGAPDGTTNLRISVAGGRDLSVVSANPLDQGSIDTLCGALAEVPTAALSGVNRMYVVEKVGAGDKDGLSHEVGAVTLSSVPTIIFDHESLKDPAWGRSVVLHEVGHLVDGLSSESSVSNTADDQDGNILFGEGKPVTDTTRPLDPAKDDWVNWYSAQSPQEDFADSHALVLEQRTAFNQANPGHDLLTEPAQVASAFLSPLLGQKAEAVVERYHQLASA